MTTVGHEAQRRGILARQQVELRPHRKALLRGTCEVRGRILHPDDVLQREAARHGLDRHVDDRAGGNVVDDDGDIDRVVDRLVVLVEAFLGRLVVIGRDDQHCIGADLGGILGELDGLVGRVRSSAGDHGHPALRRYDCQLDDALVLIVIQRRALASRSGRHKSVRAFADLPFDNAPEGFLVEFRRS